MDLDGVFTEPLRTRARRDIHGCGFFMERACKIYKTSANTGDAAKSPGSYTLESVSARNTGLMPANRLRAAISKPERSSITMCPKRHKRR